MKHIKYISAALCLLAMSCDYINPVSSDDEESFLDGEESCNCNAYYLTVEDGYDPEKVKLVIRVSNEAGPVRICVINGTVENGKIVYETTTKSQRNEIELPPNVKYTYMAEYQKGDRIIKVPVLSKLECELEECSGYKCYHVKNNIIDLSLRY